MKVIHHTHTISPARPIESGRATPTSHCSISLLSLGYRCVSHFNQEHTCLSLSVLSKCASVVLGMITIATRRLLPALFAIPSLLMLLLTNVDDRSNSPKPQPNLQVMNCRFLFWRLIWKLKTSYFSAMVFIILQWISIHWIREKGYWFLLDKRALWEEAERSQWGKGAEH